MSDTTLGFNGSLIGNKRQRQQLYDLASSNQLHHCLLFDGPSGLGKSMAARWLAQAINCETSSYDPCGKCWSCKSIAAKEHPDVIEIGLDPEKSTPLISVKQARTLISKLTTHNFRAKLRFVIIDPADAMRKEAANALLKTFEEPPTDTIFVLISSQCDNLISTIKSRSQKITFNRLTNEEMRPFYDHFPERHSELGERLSDNRPGLAVDLANGKLEKWAALRDDMIEALDLDAEKLLLFSASITKGNKIQTTTTVNDLLGVIDTMLRDILVLLTPKSEKSLINQDKERQLKKWAAQLSVDDVVSIDDHMSIVRKDLKLHVNSRLAVDHLLLRIYKLIR